MARVKKEAAEMVAEENDKKSNSLNLSRMEPTEEEKVREPEVREQNGFMIINY